MNFRASINPLSVYDKIFAVRVNPIFASDKLSENTYVFEPPSEARRRIIWKPNSKMKKGHPSKMFYISFTASEARRRKFGFLDPKKAQFLRYLDKKLAVFRPPIRLKMFLHMIRAERSEAKKFWVSRSLGSPILWCFDEKRPSFGRLPALKMFSISFTESEARRSLDP